MTAPMKPLSRQYSTGVTMKWPDIAEATKRFGQVFAALNNRSGDTASFRMLCNLGMPLAEHKVRTHNREFTERFAAGDEFAELFINKDDALKHFGGSRGMADIITTNQVGAYQRIVDAASIVFAHSAVDSAMSEYCWIAALCDPGEWEADLQGRKVSLVEVKGASYDELFSAKLEAHLRDFERQSILARADKLYSLCRPPHNHEFIRGYTYHRTRLQALDDLRHKVVHHEVPKDAFTNVEDDVEFLFQTGRHFWAMLNKRFDVKIDPRDYFGIGPGPNP